MHRSAPLNDRQLMVLQRIGAGTNPVTSRDSSLALTVYALRDRGLVTTPRRNGLWTAELTDAGQYYLEHGHHPESPRATGRAVVKSSAKTPSKPSTPPTITAAELLSQLSDAGGVLRISDPPPAERAAWRRAIDAVKRQGLVPEGHHLRHRGRDAGDLVIELQPGEHPGAKYWTEERPHLAVPAELDKPHPVVAAIKRQPKLVSVSKDSLPRALRLVQALVMEAERRGHEARVHDAAGRGFWIAIGEHAFQLTLSEGWQVTTRLPTEEELARTKTYAWQRVQPRMVEERTGQLTLELPKDWSYPGRRSRWGDAKRWRLEDKLGDVLAELEARAELAEQRRLAKKRAEAEQRRQWEEAMADARRQLVEDRRNRELFAQIEGWEKARRIRAYCEALEQLASEAQVEDDYRQEIRCWVDWARDYADRLDPLANGQPLEPEEQPIRPEDLRPYLGRWSPYGPDKRY